MFGTTSCATSWYSPIVAAAYRTNFARAVTNAIYSGAFQRHSGLTLILAHCGGPLPSLGWRIGEHTRMCRGPEDADIDPAHVAEVLPGLCYETALASSPNSLLPTLFATTADTSCSAPTGRPHRNRP